MIESVASSDRVHSAGVFTFEWSRAVDGVVCVGSTDHVIPRSIWGGWGSFLQCKLSSIMRACALHGDIKYYYIMIFLYRKWWKGWKLIDGIARQERESEYTKLWYMYTKWPQKLISVIIFSMLSWRLRSDSLNINMVECVTDQQQWCGACDYLKQVEGGGRRGGGFLVTGESPMVMILWDD